MKSALVVGLLLLFASVGSGTQLVKPGGPEFAYDANGKKIGRIIDVLAPPAYANISLQVGGISTYGTVRHDSISVGGEPLLFESTDCTGGPFLEDEAYNLWQPVTTSEPGSTVYVQQPNAPVQTITVGSQGYPGPSCQLYTGRNPIQAVAVVPLVDLNTIFMPPFTIH